jgi:hypothetical protein
MKQQIGIIALALFALAACSDGDAVPGAEADAAPDASADGAGGPVDTATSDTTADVPSGDAPMVGDAPAPSDLLPPQDVPPPACTTHDDCDDGIECTGDLCTIDGICSYGLADEICLIDGVCVATGDLNPANPCEVCESAVVLDAWAARPEGTCDDGDPCTFDDACNKDICEGTPAPSCCGDGVVEGDETCDGDCPEACDDGDACTTEVLGGSADTCDVFCEATPVLACTSGDGCCPAGCVIADDDDCPELCGNGLVEAGEICDGNCPTGCDDGDSCTVETLKGSAETCDAECAVTNIEACTTGDDCCPGGCDATSDGDCPPLCGNGVLDDGETCDGLCPMSCSSSNACTPMTVTGSYLTCDAQCVPVETITACLNDDGCCPGACDDTNDNDCDPSQTCGIDIVVYCLDHPTFAALAKISTTSPPGVMTWSYPPNNTPLPNWCATDNGTPGMHLEATSGCVEATYETGLCVMPEPLSCEASLCYECP